MMSLNIISLAVVGDNEPLVRTVLCEHALDGIGNRYKFLGADVLLRCPKNRGIWCDHPGLRHREHEGAGRPMHTMSCELMSVAGRLCVSPGCAVSPPLPLRPTEEGDIGIRRVIGIDVHRTFGEVVIWEDAILRRLGRVDMTRTALEGSGKSLRSTDEVVIEATATAWRFRAS